MENQSHDTASRILQEILKIHRRDPTHNSAGNSNEELETISKVQIPCIQYFVEAGKPVELVLPAFPAKSPNLRKVLGQLPDMAEKICLQALNTLCANIKNIYSPGAKLTICSDGRVFSDLIGVDDQDVSRYQHVIQTIITQSYPEHLRLYNLEDCAQFDASATDFARLRQLMAARYAEPCDSIKSTLMKSQDGVLLYRAITRFMFEDNWAPDYVGSKNSLQKKSKLLAVSVIQRSWAWGALLADEFPNAIRLSIHPQPATSLKIGIHMMPTQDCWMTPWHGVAVKVGEKYVLMSRHAAQLCGAQLVMEDESPSHYILETPPMQNAMILENAV
ncbi:isocyanide synthase family protein [Pseudomonas poae]|nr:isocyanide synthase family protein [Pseudomonas poae]